MSRRQEHAMQTDWRTRSESRFVAGRMNWQNAVVRIEQGRRLSQIDQELSGQQFFEEPEKSALQIRP
jgi:hypothetical protein